jgi:hypothetical protein
MKRVVSGLWGMAGVAALGAALVPAGSADAALVVDLRFTDGTKTALATPGNHEIDVWAQVTGTNTVADEGLTHLYGSVQSQQINGGAVVDLPGVGTSGITGNMAAGPVFTVSPVRGQPGTPQNLTADGVQDWGTVASTNTNTIKYNAALDDQGVVPAFLTTPGVVANLIANGVEFKVGTLTVTINPEDINALALTGVTRFNWVNGTGLFPRPQTHRIDGSTTDLNTSATYLAPTEGVSFVVPEPATFGVLGVAALGLLARRQRQAR